jgi:hypothetical protein
MATIQGVYLALFGRPADPLGLAFFNQATSNGANLTAIGDLSASAEYQARFAGQSNTQIITAIYRSLFNRDPDLAGLTFFANALANKTLTINNIAIAIYDGAQGSDLTIRNLKEAAANAFTAQIDTVAEINGYAGTAAAQSGAAFIATVTTTAPTAEQVTSAVAAATVNTGTPGSTVALTTAADVLSGTNNNDTFNGLIGTGATLSAADTINGLAGTDTLNITYANAGGAVADGTAGALLSGIEAINVRNTNATGGNGVTINATGLTGISANGAGDVSFTNVASGVALTANSTTGGALSATYVAAATAGAIALNSATTDALTLAGAGLTTATISTTGTASTTGAIDVAAAKTVTINAASNLTATSIATTGTTATLTVSGAASSVNVGTLDTDFTTVNASGLTAGGLTATMSATATTAITGGGGNDVITTGVALTTGSVDAGAGTADRLVLAADAHLATAALGAKYTNFEVLQVQNGVTGNLDNISGITAVRLNDGNATTVLSNLSATQAGAVTVLAGDGAATLGVKGATTVGQIDTVKLTFNDGNTTLNQDINATTSTFTLAGVENLEVTAVDQADITQSAATSGALASVKFFGAGDITFVTGDMSSVNFAADGSAATGKLTINATNYATNGVALTGGSAADTLTGSAQADVLNGGAGNDTLNGLAGIDTVNGGEGNDTLVVDAATQRDTLTGGAGGDNFKFTAANFADTMKTSSGTAGVVRIADFVTGTDKIVLDDTGAVATSITLASAQTIASAADITAVYAGITAISASVAAGAYSAVVVTVSAGAAAGTYLYVNDATAAVAAADDMLINITGITGTLSASDFLLA